MTNEQLKHILFIDIETVPIVPEYALLSESMQGFWDKKAKTFKGYNDEDISPEELFANKGGIFSEFSKVVCIGIGSIIEQDNEWKIRLKAISGDDEKVLLNSFIDVINRFSTRYNDIKFCGHNIKEFDMPFLCRRMVINGISLPACLQLSNKKPWENPNMDTLELWKFGDYKNYTSLALLAEVLGMPSPKNDMDGSMVGNVYWKEKDLQRIAQYCLQDVLTTANVFLHLGGKSDIKPAPVYLND